MGYRDSQEYKERERERKRLYGLKLKEKRAAAKLGKVMPEKPNVVAAKPKPAKSAKPANVGRKAKPVKAKTKAPAKPRNANGPRKQSPDRPKSLLDVAADILRQSTNEKTGWHPEIIVNTAISNGLWVPGKGKTPAATLWKNILGEIKSKGKASRFVKSGPGEFKFNEKMRDGK